MDNDDKITIKLVIGGAFFPLTIRLREEEMVREAAKRVDNLLNKYRERYKTSPTEQTLLMVAFHLSLQHLAEEQRNETKSYTDKIEELTEELEAYLNQED